MRIGIFAAAVSVLLAAPAFSATYKIDPAHSGAQFSIRHMMISNVKGQFSNVNGTVEYDPKNPTASKVEATIDVASVDTRESSRDEHLRGSDFFDVAKYPKMTFKSKKVLSATNGNMKVLGDLTLHGVTKEVVLDVDGPAKPIKDQKGVERTGASGTTKINRKDFGITYNKALDGGGIALGEEVPITIEVEMAKEGK